MKTRTRAEYLQRYPKIIENVRSSLIKWDLDDIKKASKANANLGAFILGSCYIDHLSCLYSGSDSTDDNYIKFVNDYLANYNGRDMYKDIRCRLVHNYSVGNKYAFTHNNSQLHLKENDGKICINLGDFIEDLEAAANKFFADADQNDDIKVNIAKRHLNIGILMPVDIETNK